MSPDRLRVAPGDELRDDEAGVAPFAEAELATLAVGHPAASSGHDRTARSDVPFRGRPEPRIDVGAALRDPADIARGVTNAGNPRFFVISAQRLYLFSREANRDAFAADPERFLYEVGKRWPALQEKLGQ